MDKKTLVERCQHGDREALGLLYSKYSARMMKIIRHYIADPADAGDILHDGFIVAFTQISSLRNPDKLEYWLGTIMKNLSIQHLNQVELNTLLDEDADITDMPEIQDLISLEELEAIINLLPDGYRKVFKLAVLDNKSHREIGKLLGIAPHSSSSQLFRAKEMLRKIIREQGLELAGAISVILLILALTPYMWHNRLPVTPDSPTDNRGNLILAIAKPQADEIMAIDLSSALISGPLPATYNIYTATNMSAVNEEITAETSSQNSAKSVTESSKSTDTSKPAESKTHKAAGSHRTIADYRAANELFATTATRKPALTIGAQIRTSGFNSLGNNTYDIDNIQSDISFNQPVNPTPPIPSNPNSVIESLKPKRKIEDVKHSTPITVGINANLRLTRTLSVESGVTYSYLHSRASINNNETDYKTHYIGIPLKLNLSLYTNSRLNIYGSAGGAVDLPVHSTAKTDFTSTNVSAPTQWSLSGGVGVQYSITRHAAVYAEPSIRYNFHNPGSEVITKWQDDRFEFTLPVGIRFNF